ncbi:MAG: N-(5'-phosphoribosyl)anthranilate isomerase [Chloroflexota bacterium]|nr:MAG: N-(5'-phosphoribosyl)anthranilate isomerase [Chloroflexota bacterium]
MVKVKICGITNLEDALVAVEAGADLLGFIFYKPSPRYIRPEVVREIVAGCRLQVARDRGQVSGAGDWKLNGEYDATRNTQYVSPLFVGVFVNSPLEAVAHILDFCKLDAAQLHGEESPEFVAHFQGRAFKALRPESLEEAEVLIQKYSPSNLPIFQSSHLPTFLLDAYHPHLYGGTGHVADWRMAAHIAWRYPIMLAGSLTPENVAEAVQEVQPWGVDVSSGVEQEKGRKDHNKVRAFVAAVRSLV